MDKLDSEILDLLMTDAAQPRKSVAKRAGVSEPSLSKRISGYELDGVLKRFSVEIDYDSVGYNTNSVTLIKLNDQEEIAVLATKAASLNEAIEVYTILGDWDIYIRWLCRSNGQVEDLVKSLLGGHKVQRAQTTTLGNVYKRVRGPLLSKK